MSNVPLIIFALAFPLWLLLGAWIYYRGTLRQSPLPTLPAKPPTSPEPVKPFVPRS